MGWQEKIFASISRKQVNKPHRIKGIPKINLVKLVSKQIKRTS
jgi:hypothetical protein